MQRFCDSLYGYDTVWSAKRVYFTTAAEQLSVIMMSTKRQLVVKLMEEEDLLLTAAYLQLQIMKKTRRKRKARSVWIRDWLQRRVLYTPREKVHDHRKSWLRVYMRKGPPPRMGPRMVNIATVDIAVPYGREIYQLQLHWLTAIRHHLFFFFRPPSNHYATSTMGLTQDFSVVTISCQASRPPSSSCPAVSTLLRPPGSLVGVIPFVSFLSYTV